MSLGCDHVRGRDGTRCQRQSGHNGKHRFPILSPTMPPVVPRKMVVTLSCSLCRVSVPTQVYLDPELGDGWPLHRCGLDVRPFDIATQEGKG